MSLDHFDTILAFAAVMAGLSLVITALTQALSGLLGLRGLNLKWGLEKLFATLTAGAEGNARLLVEHLLLHPLISDSTFGGLKKWWTWWRYASHVRLEELSGLLGDWRKALESPASNKAKRAARARIIKALNLEGPLWDVATRAALAALKKIDLTPAALTILSEGPLKKAVSLPAGTPEQQAARDKAIARLKPEELFSDLAKLTAFVLQDGTNPVSVEASLPLPEGIREALALPPEKRAAALASLFLDDAAKKLASQVRAIEAGLAQWFDSSMDRVSQRFTANTRIITIAGALLVSVALTVDSIDLWKQLARKPELRNQVIASSDALLKKADEMQVGSTNLPAAVYRVAANQLAAMHTNEFKAAVDTSIVTNRTAGTNWVVTLCAANAVTNVTQRLEEYEALVPQAALRQSADTLQTLLEEQLTLGVIGSSKPGQKWLAAIWEHLGGIFISVVLLSLGAPFWFNLLRSMSNLRPVLAAKDSNAEQARLKAIATGKESG